MRSSLAALFLIIILTLASCESTKKEDADYVFLYNGATVSCRGDMAEVVKNIGEPTSILESPSCAGDGADKLYSYSGFDVYTVPDGGIRRIVKIELRNDTVATPEGAAVGMTRREINEIYGVSQTESDSAIEYVGRDCRLIFVLRGDRVAGIIYVER